jgi:LPPG:FO 2-phospho-L-lactate transferase
MKVTILSGGIGGARYTRGVREHLRRILPDGAGGTTANLTVIVNTSDDMWLAGLRITPDLDSVMYTLAGANDEQRGWGRVSETERVSAELAAYGVGWPWFTLGDLDLGTHIARSAHLRSGLTLSEATALITARWKLGVTLLPMTDSEVETWVETVGDGTLPGESMHFQQWWTLHRAKLPAARFVQRGIETAVAAPGVVDSIMEADVVLIAPSNPVVSIGTIVAVSGIREALAATSAPVVGVSPIIAGAAVRGMAEACLSAIGVAPSAAAVALHYGARTRGDTTTAGLLDAWLVDSVDAAAAEALEGAGIRTVVAPLWMNDLETSTALAAASLAAASAAPAR